MTSPATGRELFPGMESIKWSADMHDINIEIVHEINIRLWTCRWQRYRGVILYGLIPLLLATLLS